VPAIAEAAAGARLIVLCNPCNPTGAVYPRHELDAVAEIAASEDLLVLADEAYDSIVYDGVEFTSALQVEGLQDRLLYAQTFSKTFAMTGFRVGYAAAPQVVVEAAGRLHFTHNGPVNSFVQRAALAALREPTDAPRRMCLEYQARRDLALEVLHGTPGVRVEPPEGAFYLWLRYDAPVPSLEVERRALEAGVAVVGGYRYGDAGEQCLRISFAASREDVREGLRRLRGVLESLEA
jgi:aspartate aminotransferase